MNQSLNSKLRKESKSFVDLCFNNRLFTVGNRYFFELFKGASKNAPALSNPPLHTTSNRPKIDNFVDVGSRHPRNAMTVTTSRAMICKPVSLPPLTGSS